MKIAAKASILLAVLFLAGCGGSDSDFPAQYTIDNGQSPSLSALVSLPSEVQFQQTELDGVLSYVYSPLDCGGDTAKEYTQRLEQDYHYSIDNTSSTNDFSAPSGQVLAVPETQAEADQTGLLLDIQWDEHSCSITPSPPTQADSSQETITSVTLSEAVAYMKSLSTSTLGLPGESIDLYSIYPQQGIVLLEDQPSLCINVYRKQTGQFEKSYLLTLSDYHLYALDRTTGQASPIS